MGCVRSIRAGSAQPVEQAQRLFAAVAAGRAGREAAKSARSLRAALEAHQARMWPQPALLFNRIE